MKSQDFFSVIHINQQAKCFDFYTMTGKNRATIALESKPFKSRLFDEEFFENFSKALGKFAERYPSAQASKVTLVLPDSAVMQDVLNMPSMKKSAMDNNFNAKIESLFKNFDNLKINKVISLHNKQFTQYAFSVIRKDLLASLYTSCSINKLAASNVISAGAATVNAVITLRPKFKGESFMFMDMREKFTRIIFVEKERASGTYILPFGYSCLSDHRMPQEDMLFDHSVAELAVVNAKEKAKQKALTMASDGDFSMAESEFGVDENGEDNGEVTVKSVAVANQQVTQNVIKVLPKKTARKLPKFMQRETPNSQDGYVYENFRVFIKWILTLIQRNPTIVMQGKPTSVLVNMPEQYEFLFEMVNQEKDKNGVEFIDFCAKDEHSEVITNHLELFGGFVPLRSNSVNVF